MAQPTAPTTLPDQLVGPLQEIRDALDRIHEASEHPSRLDALIASAGPMVAQLVGAGCLKQSQLLADGVRRMREAAEQWAAFAATPGHPAAREFEDTVYDALDCVCWALDWQDPAHHRPLPAGIVDVALEAVT